MSDAASEAGSNVFNDASLLQQQAEAADERKGEIVRKNQRIEKREADSGC